MGLPVLCRRWRGRCRLRDVIGPVVHGVAELGTAQALMLVHEENLPVRATSCFSERRPNEEQRERCDRSHREIASAALS